MPGISQGSRPVEPQLAAASAASSRARTRCIAAQRERTRRSPSAWLERQHDQTQRTVRGSARIGAVRVASELPLPDRRSKLANSGSSITHDRSARHDRILRWLHDLDDRRRAADTRSPTVRSVPLDVHRSRGAAACTSRNQHQPGGSRFEVDRRLAGSLSCRPPSTANPAMPRSANHSSDRTIDGPPRCPRMIAGIARRQGDAPVRRWCRPGTMNGDPEAELVCRSTKTSGPRRGAPR